MKKRRSRKWSSGSEEEVKVIMKMWGERKKKVVVFISNESMERSMKRKWK